MLSLIHISKYIPLWRANNLYALREPKNWKTRRKISSYTRELTYIISMWRVCVIRFKFMWILFRVNTCNAVSPLDFMRIAGARRALCILRVRRNNINHQCEKLNILVTYGIYRVEGMWILTYFLSELCLQTVFLKSFIFMESDSNILNNNKNSRSRDTGVLSFYLEIFKIFITNT